MSASDLSATQTDRYGVAIRSVPFPESGSHLSTRQRSHFGKLSSVLESLFVFLLLLSSMNVVTALAPSSKGQNELRVFSSNVDTSSVAIEGGIYLYGAAFVLMRWRRVLRAATKVWPLLALPVLACISTAWSVHPTVTLRRSVMLLAATVTAIYIGERYSIKEFARLLAQVLCLMLVLVVLFYLVAPDYVIDHYAYRGAWKGLSAYKNTFGEHMAVAVLVLVLVRFRRFSLARYLFLLISAALLVLSRSATAVICAVLGLAAIPLWHLVRSKQRFLIYLLLVAICFSVIYCVLVVPEPLFQFLGRDSTLTGRTQLWRTLLPAIASRPILGYGYAAFWSGLTPEVLNVWMGTGRRLVPIADNGYIDLCLDLGMLGVFGFLAIFIPSFNRAIDYLRSEPGLIGLWPVSYLLIFAANNMCESGLLTRGTFPFLVFAILTTSLALRHQHVARPAPRADHPSSTWNRTLPLSH